MRVVGLSILGCLLVEIFAVWTAYRGIRHGIIRRDATIGHPPRPVSPGFALFWGLFNVALAVALAAIGVWFLIATSRGLRR